MGIISQKNAKMFKLRLVLDISMGGMLTSANINELVSSADKLSSSLIHKSERHINKICYAMDIILSEMDIPAPIKRKLLVTISSIYKLPSYVTIDIHKRLFPAGHQLHIPILSRVSNI